MAVVKSWTQLLTGSFSFVFFHDYFSSQTFDDNVNVDIDGTTHEDAFDYIAFYDKAYWHITLYGSGFEVQNGELVAGSLEAIRQKDVTRGYTYFSIADLALDAATFYDALVSDSPFDEDALIQGEFAGADEFHLSRFGDMIMAGTGNDLIDGAKGNDRLYGGDGDDALIGRQGRDRLWGETGADSFVYASVNDSRGKNRDEIVDFVSADGDRVVLTEIDANAGRRGNQDFTFIGADAFSGKAGELRFAGGMLSADVDGDRVADLRIVMTGVTSMAETDFGL